MALNFLLGRDKRRVPAEWVQSSLIPAHVKKTTSPKPCHKKGDSSATYGTTSLSSGDSQYGSESSWSSSDDDASIDHEVASIESRQHLKTPNETSIANSSDENDCTAFDFLRYSPSEEDDVDLESPPEPTKSTREKWLGTDFDSRLPAPTAPSPYQRATIEQYQSPQTDQKMAPVRSRSLIEPKIDNRRVPPPTRRTQSLNQAHPMQRKLSWNLETIEVNEYVRGRATSETHVTRTYYEKAPARRRHSYNVPLSPKQKLIDLDALRKELDMRQQRFGSQHPKVGEIYNLIGNVHFRCRRYEEAIEAYEKVLPCESGIGNVSDYLPIADALGNLGTVYRAMGALDSAIEKMELSLKAHIFVEQAQGNEPEESSRVAAILYNIGLTETLRKNFHEALQKLMQCRDIKEAILGRNHLEVASTIDAIGKAHLGLGNSEEAMTCHLKALEMKKNFSPSLQSSASCVISLKNIADVYTQCKNYDAAILKCKQAARIQQSEHARLKMKLGSGKPDVIRLAVETGDTLLKLKELYTLEGDSKKSIRYGKEAQMFFQEAGLKDDDVRMITSRIRNPGIWNSI